MTAKPPLPLDEATLEARMLATIAEWGAEPLEAWAAHIGATVYQLHRRCNDARRRTGGQLAHMDPVTLPPRV